jgi:hypothetical protein
VTDRDDEQQAIDHWTHRLTQALQILDFELDQDLVRELNEQSAQHISPSAGPVSALLVGYAAGLAATNGKKEAREAVGTAADVALKLCREGAGGGPDSKGWTATAQ